VTRRGRNWDREAWRARMRRQGTDSVTGSTPPRQLALELGPPVRRRRQPTKAELRALGDAALRGWKARPR
jgi:hypothetical protein